MSMIIHSSILIVLTALLCLLVYTKHGVAEFLPGDFSYEENAKDLEMDSDHRQLKSEHLYHYRGRSIRDDSEYKMLMALQPLLDKPPNIQFWRPQKVGSSTILSLLISFSYRYNILPRRKSAQNLLCRKMAKCALEYLDIDSTSSVIKTSTSTDYATPAGSSTEDFHTHLKDYVVYGKWPPLDEHGKPRRSIDGRVGNANQASIDRVSELIAPTYMSIGHELCYLDSQLVRDQIECAFSKLVSSPGTETGQKTESTEPLRSSKPLSEKEDMNIRKAMALFGPKNEPVLPVDIAVTVASKHKHQSQARTSTDTSTSSEDINPNSQGGLKELFIVREPLSRAISIYYFWGELFMMRLRSKQKLGYQEQERSGANGGGDANENGGSGKKRKGYGNQGKKRLINLKPKALDILAAGNQRAETESAGSAKMPVLPLTPDRIRTRRLAGEEPDTGGGIIAGIWKSVRSASGKLRNSLGANLFGEENRQVTGFFTYHGNETTVPPMDIAMKYARELSYNAGAPGPTLTWSLFAQSLTQSSRIVTDSDRVMTLVTERLDESLIVMSHYMGWSLADMVTVKNRKDLSTHPSVKHWPTEVVDVLRVRLEEMGEFDMYRASVKKLDERLQALRRGTWVQEKQGTGTAAAHMQNKEKRDYSKPVDVDSEVALLKALRSRVSEVCDTPEYLERYRAHLNLNGTGLPQDISNNKLRDSNDKYVDGGHMFSFNKIILFSYDVCGSCEAHALLLGYKNSIKSKSSDNKTPHSVQAAVNAMPLLKDLSADQRRGNMDFQKCPY